LNILHSDIALPSTADKNQMHIFTRQGVRTANYTKQRVKSKLDFYRDNIASVLQPDPHACRVDFHSARSINRSKYLFHCR